MRKLLNYYKIRLIHQNPNSILHLSIFINLCEANLGIDPHFNLFHYFFHLESFASSKVVGGAYLVLWDNMTSEYKLVLINTLMKGCKSRRFYTKNVEDDISADIDSPARPKLNWTARPTDNDMV